MNKNLKFLKTMSISEFKTKYEVAEILIKRNENTGRFFFVYGAETGACTNKAGTDGLTVPVISEVLSPETGEIFYLLHQRGEGAGATTLAVL